MTIRMMYHMRNSKQLDYATLTNFSLNGFTIDDIFTNTTQVFSAPYWFWWKAVLVSSLTLLDCRLGISALEYLRHLSYLYGGESGNAF